MRLATVTSTLAVVATAVALTFAPAAGQASPSEWDPAQLKVTRAELEDLLSRYEAVTASSAYSSRRRSEAQRAADRIRTRLTEGDFRVGDRIAIQFEGQAPQQMPDTLMVEPGPSVTFPEMGSVSLAGVLRSELEEHLTEALAEYMVNPRLRAQATIRLQFDGAINRPGFYTFPADVLLSDAIMQAGGPGANTDWDDLKLRRGGETLIEDEEVSEALADGRSLDQLGLRAGDIVELPQERASQIWPRVFRYGMIITSSLLLGIRIF